MTIQSPLVDVRAFDALDRMHLIPMQCSKNGRYVGIAPVQMHCSWNFIDYIQEYRFTFYQAMEVKLSLNIYQLVHPVYQVDPEGSWIGPATFLRRGEIAWLNIALNTEHDDGIDWIENNSI